MTRMRLLLVSLLLVFGFGAIAPVALAQGNGTVFNVSPSLYTLRPNSTADALGTVYIDFSSGVGTIAGGEVFTITFSQPIVGASGIASLAQATAAADFCDDSKSGAAGKFCSAMAFSATGNVLYLTNGATPVAGFTSGYVAIKGIRIATVGLVPGSFVTAYVGAVLNQQYPISFAQAGVTQSGSVNVGQIASTTLGGTVLASLNYSTVIWTCFGSVESDFNIEIAEQWAGAWTSLSDEMALAPYAPSATNTVTNGSIMSVTLYGIPKGVTVTPEPPFTDLGTVTWGPAPKAYTGAVTNDTHTFEFVLLSTLRPELESAEFDFGVTTTGAISLQNPPMTASVTLNPMTPDTTDFPAFTYPVGALQEEPNYPLSVVDFIGCQTSMLFPYVSNLNSGSGSGALGNWDTAIAVSNTSSDAAPPFGYSSAIPFDDNLGAIPTAGSCTFYVWAAGTGGTTTPTADASPYATWTTPVVNTGGVYAFLLSGTSGAGVVNGYAIAVCNFLNGVGYAAILDNANGLGVWAAYANYLAYIIPNPLYEPRWFDSIIGEFAITPYPYYFDDGGAIPLPNKGHRLKGAFRPRSTSK